MENMDIEIIFFGKDMDSFHRMEEVLSGSGNTLVMTRDVLSCKEMLSSSRRGAFLIIDAVLRDISYEGNKIKELFSFLEESKYPCYTLWIGDIHEQKNMHWQKGCKIQGALSKPISKEAFALYFQQVSHYFSLLDKIDEQKKLLSTYSKLSSIGEVSMQVAHEVSSPLILLHEQIKQLWVGLQSKISSPHKDMLIHIDKNCDRIIRILTTLLHLSRGQSENPIKMDVRILINNVLLLFENQFKSKNIVLKISFPERMQLVEVGESELTQVLFNLIKNSIEAVENLPEKKKKWVSLNVHTKVKNHLSIEVEDSGQGVPKHIQHKIHQSFFTTKATGTGLGLSICQNILKKYGGKLFLDQKAPHTLFRMELPCLNIPTKNIPQSSQSLQSSQSSQNPQQKKTPLNPIRSLKILVVEDEVDLCKMLAKEFASNGHEAFTAFNGLEALDLMSKNKMDILICDISLPKMNGVDLVKRVREKLKVYPRVFFMTGAHKEPKLLPETHLFYKPFSLEKISRQVEQAFFDDQKSLVKAKQKQNREPKRNWE